MTELVLQDLTLKVRDIQVKFDAFETQNSLTDCVITEIDEELEEGRVGLEKLEKRVRELETDLPELIATLKVENAELRHHLNLTIDTLNAVVKIINDQIIARQPTEDPDNPDSEDLTHPDIDRHHYLEEVNELTQEEWNSLLQI